MLHMIFDKKYWFKQKRIGWGATPSTWQGWLFTALYIAVVLAATLLLIRDDAFISLILWGVGFVIINAIFITIVHFRTEGGLGKR